MKKLGLFLAAAFVALAMSATAPLQAAAVTAPGLNNSNVAQTISPNLIQKTHGWHCGVRRGYVPRLGYRALHRHKRACRRRGRCTRRHYVCRGRHGYGWRYRRCMKRRAC
ncbi:MAG: hypothetical protein RIC14_11770 [Filomicrobium sp.]